MKLKGRIALITGAGGDFGRKIALALAAEGARIAVNDLNPRPSKRQSKNCGNRAPRVWDCRVTWATASRSGPCLTN